MATLENIGEFISYFEKRNEIIENAKYYQSLLNSLSKFFVSYKGDSLEDRIQYIQMNKKLEWLCGCEWPVFKAHIEKNFRGFNWSDKRLALLSHRSQNSL
jgi:hypothetical protein